MVAKLTLTQKGDEYGDEYGRMPWLILRKENGQDVNLYPFEGQDIPGVVKVLECTRSSTGESVDIVYKLRIEEGVKTFTGADNPVLVEFAKALADATFSTIPETLEDYCNIFEVPLLQKHKVLKLLEELRPEDATKFDSPGSANGNSKTDKFNPFLARLGGMG